MIARSVQDEATGVVMARKTPMDLDHAVSLWLQHRVVIDEVKDSTLRRDTSVMKQFAAFTAKGCKDGQINVHSVNFNHVMAWKAWRTQHRVNGRPIAATTKNAEIRSVKNFFDWTRNGPLPSPRCAGVSPAATLKSKRNQRGANEELLRLAPEEWWMLLDSAETPQARWLMALCLFSFMREGEVRLATHADWTPKQDPETGEWAPGIVINREKSTQRDAPMRRDHIYATSELQEEYARWMTYYRAELARAGVFEIDPEWPLVPAYRRGTGVKQADDTYRQEIHHTAPMSRAESKVKKALAAIGYPTLKEGVHTLRRSGARGYFDDLSARVQAGEILEDTPIRIVMTLLGHASQETTEIYLGITASRRARDSAMRGARMIQRRLPPTEQQAVRPRLSIVS